MITKRRLSHDPCAAAEELGGAAGVFPHPNNMFLASITNVDRTTPKGGKRTGRAVINSSKGAKNVTADTDMFAKMSINHD
jgi:hypothetical protein